jgi:hypothetical protein
VLLLIPLVMRNAGVEADCSSFTALIQYERDAEKIMTIWDKMLEMKVTPDLRYPLRSVIIISGHSMPCLRHSP